MLAAVLYGTARSSYDRNEVEQHLGKTGTCSEQGSRLGWFVSYAADQVHPRMALVVLQRSNTHRASGPTSTSVAGRIYHQQNELNDITATHQAVALITRC